MDRVQEGEALGFEMCILRDFVSAEVEVEISGRGRNQKHTRQLN